jgi:hypothetical protein
VPFRERKERPASRVRVAAGSALRLAAGDVDVEHGPAEQLVAHRAAHDVCLLLRDRCPDQLIHRPPAAPPGPARSRSRT